MPDEDLKQNLASLLNAEIVDLQPLGGGCSYPGYKVVTSRGNFFVKTSGKKTDVFLKEANGLDELSQYFDNIPSVIAVDESFLILEYLNPTQPTQIFWTQLGQQLAQMHSQEADSFGYTQDNWIGTAIQKNSLESQWTDFFWKNRIQFKLDQIKESRGPIFDSDEINQLNTAVYNQLSARSITPRPLHGDLWRGNIHCGDSQSPWLIDPAFYYGDPEADLAMTECFGGFSESFYTAYKNVLPPEEGYQQRKHIYNLYHMLNHYLIFGDSYKSATQSLVSQIVSF